MAFGTLGSASAIAAAQAAIPRLNLAIPRKPGGGSVGLASTAAGARQPSVGHAIAAWLFGGSTPMDDERARIAGAQQAQQMLEMRQALLSKLTGGGSVPAAVPLRQDGVTPSAAPLTPRIDPLKATAQDVSAGLGEQAFGQTPDLLTQAAPRVAVDAPQLPAGVPMKSGAPAQSGGIPTLRGSADWLLPMVAMGVPGAKEAIDFLDKAGPKAMNVNGHVIDERDPGSVGQFLGDAPTKGAEPIYDANRRQVGWRMADGAIQAISQAAEADERGKTSGQFVDVPQADGSTVKMLGSDAIPLLSQRGQPGTTPGPAGSPGFGRTQTPADKKLAEGRAETQVNREQLSPKARSALESQAKTTDLVIDTIDKALTQIDGWTAGMAAPLRHIPGTPAKDLDSTLNTIKANIGFDTLAEMRANSPTGGALGQISDTENKLLQSVQGAIDQGQSPEQMKANLRGVRQRLAQVRDQRRAAFNSQFGGESATPAARAQFTPQQAAAELARRRAARGQ